jgi:D-alanine-D-alanine ligase
MKVDRDWWKHYFNDIYLITDARSVCNEVLTERETDILEESLGLNRNDRILDLCGGHGRHSMALARRGYRDLTVLDFSDHLIRLGRKMAKESGLSVKFVRADARRSALKGTDYSAIFIMANSFGYFLNDKENVRLLKEAHRLLKKGGRLLLDLTDPDYLKKNLKPLSWHDASEDIIVLRKRILEGDVVKAREIVISKGKGLLRDGSYCERIYAKDKINRLLRSAGYRNLSVKRNLSLHGEKTDYGFMTSRMFITARKG